MKCRIAAFVFLIFIVLFIVLEWTYKYHFFFIEQNQLFLHTTYYFTEMAAQPGGLANYLAEFLVQFFAIPYMGASITALLLAGAGFLTALICKRIAPTALYFLSALPVISLLCIHFDSNYFYQGTIAFLLMLALFYLYTTLQKYSIRLTVGAIVLPLLFWWAGFAALIYAVCIIVWELINKTPKWYLSLLLGVEAVMIAYASVYFSVIGEYHLVFTPKLYYQDKLLPGNEIYYVWISLPVVLILGRLFGKPKKLTLKKEVFTTALQLVVLAIFGWYGVTTYIDLKSYKLKKLSFHSQHAQWDAIIEDNKGVLDNYLYLNYLNLALAEKGVLANDLFKYDQHGANGLFVPWDRTPQPAIVLSNIHFCIGNSAIAQELAFESWQATSGFANPRSLMRLIETNIILGYYPVAEKYIDILDHTLLYSDWANAQRKFLYADEMVENDPLLGEKRRCLTDDNYLANPHLVTPDLLAIASKNPGSKTAIEYLGSLFLLAKDLNGFREFVETNYKTERLPLLPRSFQEAIITLYENNTQVWEHYQISPEMAQRFRDFKQQVLANKNNSGLPHLLKRSYGDTYWHYYMFK